jgi:hypothetical protein
VPATAVLLTVLLYETLMVLPVPGGGGGFVVTLYVMPVLFDCPFQFVKPIVMALISAAVNPEFVLM